MEYERHRARVESAVPLTPDAQLRVRSRIESVYGPQFATEFRHDNCLIGGMRIQVGSDRYDGSIISELLALQMRLGVTGTNGTRSFTSKQPQVEEPGQAR